MGKKVIAISGMPGSGKTTVSGKLLENYDNAVYFDFGFLFRPLTYFLVNELNLTEEEIRSLVESKKLEDLITIGYKVKNKKVEISINSKFYTFEQLNTLQMNMDTVMVGSIIGDDLTPVLRDIVSDLKDNYNVILNARRPVVAYPNLDKHFFLKCSKETRVDRKMNMNHESKEITETKLSKRDIKEKESGFWKVYDFTHIIDTTNLTKEEVYKEVVKEINGVKNLQVNLNNLTLILGSYRCNKNCPFCIAKNNQKFSNYNDKLDTISNIFDELLQGNISFNRFVLSGNGEPSLYSCEDLKKVKEALLNHKELFKKYRSHSSGNVFFDKDKFDILNDKILPIEFEILRVDLNPDVDSKVLGYDKNYLESPLFDKANIVKCDIAFTDYLNTENIKEDLEEFLDKHPSIKKVRFKKLLAGDNDTTPQGRWTRSHALNDEEIDKIITSLGLIPTEEGYESKDGKIVYKENGNYGKDIVINNGNIQDYNYNIYTVKSLIKNYKNK